MWMSSRRGQEPDVTSEASIAVAGSADDWRAWLARNCRSAKEVWLVLHHHGSGTPPLRYHEAVEQALCFGWIDGLHRGRGADSSQLRFTPRTARSRWSQLNRQRAAKMIELGLMTEYGQAAIAQAKAAGTWQLLPDEPRRAMPDDLKEQLDGNDAARMNFESFPPSSKRLIAEWIAIAKRPDTRRRRIDQTVNLAALNIRANHPATRAVAPRHGVQPPDEPPTRTLQITPLCAQPIAGDYLRQNAQLGGYLRARRRPAAGSWSTSAAVTGFQRVAGPAAPDCGPANPPPRLRRSRDRPYYPGAIGSWHT
jgi:uncharacterized protein YdeI (YjbR/CyaY-like superfamily)